MKIKYKILVLLILLQFKAIAQPACGTCSSPVCKIYGPVTGTSLVDAAAKTKTELSTNPLGYGIDLNFDPMFGMAMPLTGSTPKNWTYCYKFTISNSNTSLGLKLGLKQFAGSPSFKSHLYKESEPSCISTVEIPANRSKVDASSFFNPEWDGLDAGNYKVCIDFSLPTSGDMIGTVFLGYYTNNSTSSPTTNCKIQNSNINTCNCFFVDSGDSTANYGANEDLTYTICPSDPTKRTMLSFTDLNLADAGDKLTVYDGKFTTDLKLYSPIPSDGLPSAPIRATLANSSGCLTVNFKSDASGFGRGWNAKVSCWSTCTEPIAKEQTIEFTTNKDIKACLGTSITFDASSSIANSASIVQYSWDFGDGTQASGKTALHKFDKSGVFTPTLTVTNSDGCTSSNAISTVVTIPSLPVFNGSTSGSACLDSLVCLEAKTTWNPVSSSSKIVPAPVTKIPDLTATVEVPITISGYGTTKTITSVNDIQSICINIEHSAIDDITVTLIAPNGSQINLHKNGGGASALGVPTMDYAAFKTQCQSTYLTGSGVGTGWNYCFKSSAAETWKQKGNANWTSASPCYQIPSGDYKPVDAFTPLIGSSINGTWKIKISDKSDHDDGTVFSWSLNLDPNLLTTVVTKPTLATQKWTPILGTDIVSGDLTSKLCVKPTSNSNIDYKYEVIDNFGCKKDTIFKITIKPSPLITPSIKEVCLGVNSTLFDYTTSSTGTAIPNKYAITWDPVALTDGFVTNTSDVVLALSNSILIPTTAKAKTYNGSLIVKNAEGCASSAQPISLTINPLPIITGVFNCIIGGNEILTGSNTPAALNPWSSSATSIASINPVVGHPDQIQVDGLLKGKSDISFTDSKGCQAKEQFTVGFLCDKIIYTAGNQTVCNGAVPNPISVTTDDPTEDIDFVYFPLAQTDTTIIYSGGTPIATVTPTTGSGLAAFSALDLDKIKLLPPNDYFVYAKFNNSPTENDCRAFKEIKVTIKDTTSPLITIVNTGTLNEYKVTWIDVPDAVSYKVDTVTYVKGTVPTLPNLPNWKSLPSNITANHTLQAPLIFPNIPMGRTLFVQVTPLDNTNTPLTCNLKRQKSIDNPNCPNPPVLEPLNILDTVCEGASLDKLIGKISSTSVSVNFVWQASIDSINWNAVPSIPDFLITNPTANKETNLAIKSNLLMNNSFVRLIGKDLATGQCSDTTLPVKILVNEIPDASISISPDPAKLCVGDSDPIEVTFQGSKGVKPYRFDFKLDASPKDTTSSSPDGKVIFPFTTVKPIDDTTFILDSITDKNGCTAKFTGKTVKLEVVPVPKPEFQADKTIGCYPLEVIFTDKSAVLNTDVEWDFGNGDVDNTSLGVVKYIFEKSGDYTISFKSTINGCSDTTQKTDYIHVKDRPEAQFSPKKTNISLIDPEIQFINSSSSNSVYYKWIFGDGSPVSNLVNPKHIYIGDGSTGLPNPGKYTVELYAYINQDCWDSTSTIITIDDEQIYYIPNTFTPNGDEKNNTFQPVFTSGYDPQNYHFFVYNRWGELIFESNNPAIGWDGTYGSKLLANDTYTWKLQFKEKMTEKEHFLTGHVNLFK